MKIWQKSAGYAAARFISSGIGFAMLPVLVRFLPPAEFGAFQVLEFWALMVSFAVRMGLDQAIFKFRSTDDKINGSRLFIIFSIMSAMAMLLLSVAVLAKAFLGQLFLNDTGAGNLALLAIVWGIADAFLTAFGAVFQAEEKVKSFIIIDSFRAIIWAAFSVIFLAQYGGVSAAVLAKIASAALAIFIFAPQIIKKLTYHIAKDSFRSMLLYSMPLAINLFAVRIANFADRWFLAKFIDMESAGEYGAAVKVASMLTVLLLPVRQAWMPRLFSMHRDGSLDTELPKIWLQLAGSMALAAFVLIFFAPELFSLIVGSTFKRGALVLPIIVAAYYLDALILLADAGIYLSGKTVFAPILTTFSAIIVVTLDLIAIPHFGIFGAAIAAFLGFLSLFFACITIGQLYYKVNIPFEKVWFCLACVCMAAFLVFFCKTLPLRAILWISFSAITVFVCGFASFARNFAKKLFSK